MLYALMLSTRRLTRSNQASSRARESLCWAISSEGSAPGVITLASCYVSCSSGASRTTKFVSSSTSCLLLVTSLLASLTGSKLLQTISSTVWKPRRAAWQARISNKVSVPSQISSLSCHNSRKSAPNLNNNGLSSELQSSLLTSKATKKCRWQARMMKWSITIHHSTSLGSLQANRLTSVYLIMTMWLCN